MSGGRVPKRAALAPPGSGPFRIRAAAELSGVPAATLRAWERRYGVPVPRRTTSAYRLYTAADVAQVRRLRALVAQGVSPAEAARAVLATPPPSDFPAPAGGGAADFPAPAGGGAVDFLPSAAGEAADFLAPAADGAADAAELARARLLAAARRFDAPLIDGELARLALLLDANTLYERVVSPLLVEIGRLWGDGMLSIAQEHLLSERLEYATRTALKTLERPGGPLVLIACIDREQHVLGMLGAGLRLAANGARVVVLGAMTPPQAIAEAVASLAPRLVGLSACVAPEAPRALMQAYGEACAGTPWVLGGRAAEALRAAVVEAGGFVALGAAREWHARVSEWLRAAPAR